jgi:phosphatidate cytidylyltransferase
MLVQRVITAIVLLVVLAGALLASTPWPLMVLLGLAAACALWEWLRLVLPSSSALAPVVAGVLFFVCALALSSQWVDGSAPSTFVQGVSALLINGLVPLAAVAWVFGATALVVRGNIHSGARAPGDANDRDSGRAAARESMRAVSGPARSGVFAVVAVAAAWAALVRLYLLYGAWLLVSLLALVWFADIAAYFVGKAFGRHKLAPRVSPGKTWEGAVGGVAAATLWVVAGYWLPGSFGDALAARWPWWAVVVVGILLAALSIVGDLFESLLKRRAGVKDSSRMLPGHGGVYDRIDALLPVAPVALLLLGV